MALDEARRERELTLHGRLTRMAAEEQGATVTNEFVAMVAHELRNGLAPIAATLAIGERVSRDDAHMNALFRRATHQIARVARLVDDLLAVAHDRRSGFALHVERLDLRDTVRTVLEALNASGKVRAERIAFSGCQDPLIVNGDPDRLEQVFINLIDNAVKYTAPERLVGLVLRRQQGTAVATVWDRGMGLDAHELAHVFDRFFRADRWGEDAAGVGLGLAIVRDLVAQHGGTITAWSAGHERGSAFIVRLPLARGIQECRPTSEQRGTIHPLGGVHDDAMGTRY